MKRCIENRKIKFSWKSITPLFAKIKLRVFWNFFLDWWRFGIWGRITLKV